MLQLENKTPFEPSFAVLPNRDGIDTLFIIVKATVMLVPKIALAPTQVPPHLIDEYYEDPHSSSLCMASDLHIGKSGTDVLVMGHARETGGAATSGLMVGVTVAEREKRILVMGDRNWLGDGTPSEPAPFFAIPLVWERAFGGTDPTPDSLLAEERNPIGLGFMGRQPADALIGTPVPNLEDPKQPLRQLGEMPAPCCFAPTAASWLPRRSFAGTYDENWQRNRAPYLPDDFDPRFFNCAAPELTFDRYLEGGEPVEIFGMSERGAIGFTVPSVRPVIQVTVAGKQEEPHPDLETLTIEPDENRAMLTWRAALPCDRQALKIEKILVRLRRSSGN
jgi:hypothetical protein